MTFKTNADGGKNVNFYNPDNKSEKRPTKKLHHFNLPGPSWADQRRLICMKVEDIEKIERLNNVSIPRNTGPAIEDNKPNQTPSRKESENRSIKIKRKSKKSKFIISSDDSDGDQYITEVGIEAKEKNDKKKQQNEDNDSLPLKLRTRRAMATRGLTIEDLWRNEAGSSRTRRPTFRIWYEKVHERPKFSVALSKKEIEEDFIKMTGCKPPKKPKRTRAVQKYLDSIFPGLKLGNITLSRY